MCLLIVLHRLREDAPLVVAANRDEFLDRPARPFGVLHPHGPRILGGLDERAGGTWLAVNQHGVVAGLTNTPLPGGPDPGRRSRGELPLALAGFADARLAARTTLASLRGGEYNPCWVLVADRRGLYLLDLSRDGVPLVEELAPGLHVLENRSPGGPSPKAEGIRARLEPQLEVPLAMLPEALAKVLASHDPPPALASGAGPPRPPEVEAACVHLPGYGTRASTLVIVPPGLAPPRVLVTEGPPCRERFRDSSGLWDRGDPGGGA